MHAALDFALAFPDVARTSKTLVWLAVRDELTLLHLYEDARARRLLCVSFHEPDLDGALTAVALEPAARRLVARLPLALAMEAPLSRTRGGGR